MATETTPLRDAQPQRSPSRVDDGRAFHKQRLAGLAAFAVVIVSVGLWVSISASHEAHSNAAPIKVKAVPSSTLAPKNTSAPTPLPTVEAKEFTCGTAKNEAGYINLPNKKDDHYFYWMFESRSSPTTDPLVVWLTGGPGCSSLMALLTENGPCKVSPDLTTTLNPHSWNTEANVVWLDQPTDVGYSYGDDEDLDHDEDNVQENIYWFLQGFLDKHPEFEGRPLFITGESYGGHYIPAAAHYIWLANKANETLQRDTNATARINLQGIAIGNGLVNPVVQFGHFLDMEDNAYNITLLNETQLETAKEAVPACQDVLSACQTNSSACFEMDPCGTILNILGGAHRNMYDLRLECNVEDGTDCYNMSAITEYLNSPPVQTYLNISQPAPAWEECSTRVGEGFAGDIGKNFAPYIADLLNDDALRILIYHGDADLMCNWIGGQAWVSQLEWKHQAEFNSASNQLFEVVAGADKHQEPIVEIAGSVRSFENRFSFLRVFNSGHMVPRDQPLVALEMLRRFLRNEPIGGAR